MHEGIISRTLARSWKTADCSSRLFQSVLRWHLGQDLLVLPRPFSSKEQTSAELFHGKRNPQAQDGLSLPLADPPPSCPAAVIQGRGITQDNQRLSSFFIHFILPRSWLGLQAAQPHFAGKRWEFLFFGNPRKFD